MKSGYIIRKGGSHAGVNGVETRDQKSRRILGVTINSNKRTINKAFRKLVLKAHPNKGGTENKLYLLYYYK